MKYAVLIAVAALLSSPALAQGTPEQRAACEGDALKFCAKDIPNADKIEACLRARLPRFRRPAGPNSRRSIGNSSAERADENPARGQPKAHLPPFQQAPGRDQAARPRAASAVGSSKRLFTGTSTKAM
ncbi:MAG: hypothetical protein U1E19_08500 [Rhodoblastus sp.]